MSRFVLSPADRRNYVVPIMPPLSEGNAWDPEILSAFTIQAPVATEYRLRGGAFTIEFPLPQEIKNPSDFIIVVFGFKGASRTAAVAGGTEVLGSARIRVE